MILGILTYKFLTKGLLLLMWVYISTQCSKVLSPSSSHSIGISCTHDSWIKFTHVGDQTAPPDHGQVLYSLINKDKRLFYAPVGIPFPAHFYTSTRHGSSTKSVIKFYLNCKKQLNFSFFIQILILYEKSLRLLEKGLNECLLAQLVLEESEGRRKN